MRGRTPVRVRLQPRSISAGSGVPWWLCSLSSPPVSHSSTSVSRVLTSTHTALNWNRPRTANSLLLPHLSEVSVSHRTGPPLFTWPTSKERQPYGFTLWMAPHGCSPERRTAASRFGLPTVNRLLFLQEGSYCEQALSGGHRLSSAMWARHGAERGPRMAALFSGLLVTACFRYPSRVACPGRSLHPKPLQMVPIISGRRSFRGAAAYCTGILMEIWIAVLTQLLWPSQLKEYGRSPRIPTPCLRRAVTERIIYCGSAARRCLRRRSIGTLSNSPGLPGWSTIPSALRGIRRTCV